MLFGTGRTARQGAESYRLEDDRRLWRYFQADKTPRKRVRTALAFLKECTEQEEAVLWEQQADEILRLLKEIIEYYEALKENDWTPPELKHTLVGKIKKKFIRDEDWNDLLHVLARLQAGKRHAIARNKWRFAELCQLHRTLLNPQVVLRLLDTLLLLAPPVTTAASSPEVRYLSQTLLRNVVDYATIAAVDRDEHQSKQLKILKSTEPIAEKGLANTAMFTCILQYTLYSTFQDEVAMDKMQPRPVSDFRAWHDVVMREAIFPVLFPHLCRQADPNKSSSSSNSLKPSSCPFQVLVHIEAFARQILYNLPPPYIEELWRGPQDSALMEEVLGQSLARGHDHKADRALVLHVLATYKAWGASQLYRPACMQGDAFGRYAVSFVSHTIPIYRGSSNPGSATHQQQQQQQLLLDKEEEEEEEKKEMLVEAIAVFEAVLLCQQPTLTDGQASHILDLALEMGRCYFVNESSALNCTSERFFRVLWLLLQRPSILLSRERLGPVRSKLVGQLGPSDRWRRNHSGIALAEVWGAVVQQSCALFVKAVDEAAKAADIANQLTTFDHLLHLLRPPSGKLSAAFQPAILSVLLKHVLDVVRGLVTQHIVPARHYTYQGVESTADLKELQSPVTFIAPASVLALFGPWFFGACDLLDDEGYGESVSYAVEALLLLLTTQTYERLPSETEASILGLISAMLHRGELRVVAAVLQHGWPIFHRDVPGAAPGLLKPFLQAAHALVLQDAAIISTPGLDVRKTREAIIRGITTITPLLHQTYQNGSCTVVLPPAMGPMRVSGVEASKVFDALTTVGSLRPVLADLLLGSLSLVRDDNAFSRLVLNAIYVAIHNEISSLKRQQQHHGDSSLAASTGDASSPLLPRAVIHRYITYMCKVCSDDHASPPDLVLTALDRLRLLASSRPDLEIYAPESVTHVLKHAHAMGQSLHDSSTPTRLEIRSSKLAALYELIGRWLLMDTSSRYAVINASLMDVVEAGLLGRPPSEWEGSKRENLGAVLTTKMQKMLMEGGMVQSPRDSTRGEQERKQAVAVAEAVLSQLLNHVHAFPPPQGIEVTDFSRHDEVLEESKKQDDSEAGPGKKSVTHLVVNETLLVSVVGSSAAVPTTTHSTQRPQPGQACVIVRTPSGTFYWRASVLPWASEDLSKGLVNHILKRRLEDTPFRRSLCAAALAQEGSEAVDRRTVQKQNGGTTTSWSSGGLMANLATKLSPRSSIVSRPRHLDDKGSNSSEDNGEEVELPPVQSPCISIENPLAGAEQGDTNTDRTLGPSDSLLYQQENGVMHSISGLTGSLLDSLELLSAEPDPTLIGGHFTLQNHCRRQSSVTSTSGGIWGAPSDVMLARIIHDDECLKEFEAFLLLNTEGKDGKAALRGLRFISAVHRFQQAAGKQKRKGREQAMAIVNEYLKSGGPSELTKLSIANASATVQQKILTGSIHANLFDAVQQEAAALLIDKAECFLLQQWDEGKASSRRVLLHHALAKVEKSVTDRAALERLVRAKKTNSSHDETTTCSSSSSSSSSSWLPSPPTTQEDCNRLFLGHLGLLVLGGGNHNSCSSNNNNHNSIRKLRMLKTTGPAGSKSVDELTQSLQALDKLPTRGQISIAVLYVASGQVLDTDILASSGMGSGPDYNSFVDSLGWTGDLKRRQGFANKLMQAGHDDASLTTACYYADSATEVIFHVISRMGSGPAVNMHLQEQKQACAKRRLAVIEQDLVHVVWSEHARDYAPATIKTTTLPAAPFILVVYPFHRSTQGGLYRTQVHAADQTLAAVGPLTDGMVVSRGNLGVLVRQTAVNAHHELLRKQPHHAKSTHEVRRALLDEIIQRFSSTQAEILWTSLFP